jgi:Lipocalin-like domain
MIALLTFAGRRPAASSANMEGLFQSMIAYTGHLSVEGNKVVTRVDGVWDPSWVGNDQARYCTFDGCTLSVRSAPMDHPAFPGQQVVGYADWQREA